MKRLPPRKPAITPLFTVQSDMYPPNVLPHVSELLSDVIETIENAAELGRANPA